MQSAPTAPRVNLPWTDWAQMNLPIIGLIVAGMLLLPAILTGGKKR